MTFDNNVPMALYKANFELMLRIGNLLQENRQRWMSAGAGSASEAFQKSMAETQRMLASNDWTSLTTLPGEAFWKSLQAQSNPLQANAEAAIQHQMAFAQGLQEAFRTWQQQCAEAMQGAASAANSNAFFEQFLSNMTPMGGNTEPPTDESAARAKAKKR